MIVFPNAKINLGLQVKAKRPDGFHDLETVFFPINCTDMLEAVRAEEFAFTTSGLPIDAASEHNLCIKAWNILAKDFSLSPVKMHLHKQIPMGAGLGGGSSDGAFTLLLINKLFKLELSEELLINYALQLGSDCPFFIQNKPVFATGRGEIMEPVEIPSMKGKKILLVNPALHISTREAFDQLELKGGSSDLRVVVKEPVERWRDGGMEGWRDGEMEGWRDGGMENDFEAGAIARFPEIAQIREELYKQGALYAAMTGTGSTVFGIFNEVPAGWEKHFPTHYRCMATTMA
ncbi:4-(cytidine 5'-diphospho)-2-C-methyl-D-erythritol kinase [Flavihumibacter sp. ZG627]|uniref:4-(cytidine 5'-diphospho)-2-C-methyl-D-erythritol kinase n=1 Tax=Flavihumibacter sp. ZG627 TaxID=1463156 RepID=UPI00057C802C|nr:4-(cytidine 5'-diphospho)-2-C-methyl-D-erythritol kinase [Flavihumibacter sp. ZG627]KIC91638.1 hypothetical protein HY58_05225 [Flavihumibacter sp. ZG627]